MDYTKSRYPYLVWIKSHLNMHRYSDQIAYNKGDTVTIGRSVFESTIDNNRGNHPTKLINWIRLM